MNLANGNSLGEAGGNALGSERLAPWWLAVTRIPRPNGSLR